MSETGSDVGEFPSEDQRAARDESESTDSFERLFLPRLSPRQRAQRMTVAAGAPLLAVLVILATFAPVRMRVRSMLVGAAPTTAINLNPAYNRLYLDVDAPWLRVTIDNRSVAVPAIGHQPPLALSLGRHILAWQGDPFIATQCSLSVPAAADDTCIPYEEGELHIPGEPDARLIRLAEDLATVQPGPRDTLMSAIRQTMVAAGGVDTVQPDESYFTFEKGIVKARTPLTATLNLVAELQPTGGPMDNCLPNVQNTQVSECPLDTDYCRRVCSVTYQYRGNLTGVTSRQSWLALAPYNPSWSYVTLDGKTLGANEPIELGGIGVHEQLAMFALAWDGSGWHTQVVYGPNQQDMAILGIQAVGGSPLCLAANDYFIGGSDPQTLATYAQARIISAANPAQGCVAEGIVGANAATPTLDAPRAIYLERFGLFLAANDLARRNQPNANIANAYERALAQQIATFTESGPS